MNNKKICALLLVVAISSQASATGSKVKPPMVYNSFWEQVVAVFTF
jgi:hypothetical protein